MKAIEGMTYLGGGTNDADALQTTGSQVMNQYSGARGDTPRIAVLVTDGGSSNPQAAAQAADKLRQQNIAVLTVGVGSRVSRSDLNNIADSPAADNTFYVNDYDSLDSISDQLIAQMCNGNNQYKQAKSLTFKTLQSTLHDFSNFGHPLVLCNFGHVRTTS